MPPFHRSPTGAPVPSDPWHRVLDALEQTKRPAKIPSGLETPWRVGATPRLPTLPQRLSAIRVLVETPKPHLN
ncbi:MAG TPA: hypothetical protein EYG39_01180 [Rhodothermales bacterium]|nr:hypothetical protein [Rhodothermales bacterium]